MIILNAPIQQDKIIECLTEKPYDGVEFSFKEKQGIKLIFDVVGADSQTGAKIAKETIKAQPWGSVLYFQVETK